MKEPSSKLGKLWHKFQNSGMRGNPVITDAELRFLRKKLTELSDFMKDRNDSTMRFSLLSDAESVNRMIIARKFK